MNQARAQVHVYTDGSVSVSTGAVEMGQGVNTKMVQVVCAVFSIDPDLVKVQATSTFSIANTSPTAASATADLNGKAVLIACTAILGRLKEVAATEPGGAEMSWKQLVMAAFVRRVSLSEHAHYATPDIHFDACKEKGHPFAYHVYGTAIVIATLDCLRGRYKLDAVKVVHDSGVSMNPTIDRGQIEGGIVQGIGWMTMEEVVYDETGRLRSNTLSTYKVPDIYSVPSEISIDFLRPCASQLGQFASGESDNLAIFRSKAVGEPPLMYGIGAYFALRNAILAFNPSAAMPFNTPLTPEKALMGLYSNKLKHVAG
jgi:xanthine dehydrogenase large subunit